jgi:amidophosphoribosyltransferase
MAKLIGADSLAFISLDGLYRAVGEEKRDPAKPSYCDACFSGEYPTVLTDLTSRLDEQQLSFLNSAAAE